MSCFSAVLLPARPALLTVVRPSARPGSGPAHPWPSPHRTALVTKAPCRRCQLSGTPCIFEKPEKKNVQPMANGSVE